MAHWANGEVFDYRNYAGGTWARRTVGVGSGGIWELAVAEKVSAKVWYKCVSI